MHDLQNASIWAQNAGGGEPGQRPAPSLYRLAALAGDPAPAQGHHAGTRQAIAGLLSVAASASQNHAPLALLQRGPIGGRQAILQRGELRRQSRSEARPGPISALADDRHRLAAKAPQVPL